MSSIQGTTVIKGTFYWPCLAKKNTMKNKYTLDVGRLSKKEASRWVQGERGQDQVRTP